MNSKKEEVKENNESAMDEDESPVQSDEEKIIQDMQEQVEASIEINFTDSTQEEEDDHQLECDEQDESVVEETQIFAALDPNEKEQAPTITDTEAD